MAGGQPFGIPSAGGNLAVNRLSKKLRALGQPLMRYRQFTSKSAEFGKRQGSTLLFDKRLNLSGDPSTGSIVAEGSPIPRSGYSIGQGSCVAQASGHAIPWTEELATFAEFDIDKVNREVLVDYMAKALNYRAYDQFNASNVCYIPPGGGTPAATWDTDGTPSTAADRNVTLFDVKNVVDALKKGVYGSAVSAPVEAYDGANYMAIGSVDYTRALRDDSDWENAARYGDPERLFAGEVGRIFGTRTVEDNHILGLLGSAGTYKGEAFIFGKDPVIEIIAVPEEVRIDIPSDFGRDRAIAFYYLGGFSIVWSYNATTEPDNRIVRITSS